MSAAILQILVADTEVRNLAAVGTLPGVAVVAAAGRNGPGTGRLRSYRDGTWLAWQAPGSASYGVAVACAADGSYVLEDGDDPDRWLRVQVYRAHLVPGPAEDLVHLRDVFSNAIGGAAVSAADAIAGRVDTVELTLVAQQPAGELRVWLAEASAGLELSADGLSWSAPTTEETALALGSLLAGQSRPLFLRRTIPAAAASTPALLNLVHLSFLE
jgi:hypothetical protein